MTLDGSAYFCVSFMHQRVVVLFIKLSHIIHRVLKTISAYIIFLVRYSREISRLKTEQKIGRLKEVISIYMNSRRRDNNTEIFQVSNNLILFILYKYICQLANEFLSLFPLHFVLLILVWKLTINRDICVWTSISRVRHHSFFKEHVKKRQRA